MALRSINLPGIGTKYELVTDKDDTIAIFFLKNGNIQMYTLPHDGHTPCVAEAHYCGSEKTWYHYDRGDHGS